jgi:hypothetical protein
LNSETGKTMRIAFSTNFYRSEKLMSPKENKIVEKICEIPLTLNDIAESIFEGVSTNNILMHRLLLPEEDDSGSFYLCEGLCKSVFSEPEIVYPYVSGEFSGKYAFSSGPYRFMLPYESSDKYKSKDYRIIPSEELKTRFPMAYGRIQEYKNRFLHNNTPLNSADYSIRGEPLLEYLYTPKIIVTESYHLQAAYDSVGNHVFVDGCGIVLKDPSRYPYVTAVLNSPIARLFPALCKSEMIFENYTYPAVLGSFPIVFPENRQTEDLINIISSYLVFLNKQKYAMQKHSGSYEVPEWLQELVNFYEQTSNLLILDTYFINDPDPEFLEALEENIHPCAGDIETDNNDSLLGSLYFIMQKILETSKIGKFRFNMEGLTNSKYKIEYEYIH